MSKNMSMHRMTKLEPRCTAAWPSFTDRLKLAWPWLDQTLITSWMQLRRKASSDWLKGISLIVDSGLSHGGIVGNLN